MTRNLWCDASSTASRRFLRSLAFHSADMYYHVHTYFALILHKICSKKTIYEWPNLIPPCRASVPFVDASNLAIWTRSKTKTYDSKAHLSIDLAMPMILSWMRKFLCSFTTLSTCKCSSIVLVLLFCVSVMRWASGFERNAYFYLSLRRLETKHQMFSRTKFSRLHMCIMGKFLNIYTTHTASEIWVLT